MRPILQRHRKSHFVERRILLGVLNVVGHPWIALFVALILLAASGLSAMRWLNISSDQDKLFSQKVQFFADFIEFDRLFPENDALYVVIEPKPGQSPALRRWTGAADAIAKSVRQTVPKKYVESVDERVPLDKLGRQAMLFEPADRLRQDFADIIQFGQLARIWGENLPGAGISGAVSGFALGRTRPERFLSALNLDVQTRQKIDPGTTALARQIADSWTRTLSHPNEPVKVGVNVPDLAQLGATDPGDLGYYYDLDQTDKSKSNHLLLVRIYPHVDYHSLSATVEPVEAIRKAVNAAAKDFPEFNIGTTGRPALDADEMASTDRDSTIAEIIAAVVVFIGLVVMLRSLWLALAAELALGVGIGWTFGWATISVGELNLLSIVFLIALIGIGMDYLVQILVRYRAEARRHARPKAIWARVFRYVSAPINTACFGAAGAFLVSMLTNFRGAAELGIIAGGGLLLCLLAGYTVLPALLTIFPAKLSVDIARRPTGTPPRPMGPKRLLLPAAWVALIAIFSPWATRTHFDPNLLNLQAPNLESTKLIRKLQTWSAVVLSKDPGMLAKVRDAVRNLPTVAGTQSILDAHDNYQWLHAHENELPRIAWSPPPPIRAGELPDLSSRASALAATLAALPPAAFSQDRNDRTKAILALRAFAGMASQSPSPGAAARLGAWQDAFIGELQAALAGFQPHPLNLEKVPAELRSHYVSSDGFYALYIDPKKDLWERDALGEFVNQVNDAVAKVPNHPRVTGIASDIYYTTREVRKSFIKATIYALSLIAILVLIDLRNVRHTLLAISVLATGLPVLIELMGYFNVSWNFANFFGLPILIGAGHEYGVFMIHRYRETLRDPRRAWRFWDVADRALLLCAYITSSSFGFFWAIANHRGLKSLGLVMALGTGCIYLSTIMVLRPLLLWRLENRHRVSEKLKGFEVIPPKHV
ncbi:MAG TPA: MMPL family transporter [Tepidisphaeraceae bacterium]|nr:MMPL family transporter [Tepidisphaeraceae bacterium]